VTPFNEPVGTPLHSYPVLPSSIINLPKKEDSASVGIVPELLRISDYLTTPHENSNNFSSSTGMMASKLSCKA
jgi:hypothetical protein